MWSGYIIDSQPIVDHAIAFFNQFGLPIVIGLGGMLFGGSITAVVINLIKRIS